MNLFYPPYLEGKLPAQYGDALSIPFELNRAQGPLDLKDTAVRAQLKQANTGIVLSANLTTGFNDCELKNGKYWASFSLSEVSLKVGQSYKIQLTFGEGNYFSTVGVFKYTAEPSITIEGMSSNSINSLTNSITGVYEMNGDSTEKAEEYKFNLYLNGDLVESSGWRPHLIENDVSSTKSYDTYIFEYDLSTDEIFNVEYLVRTINGLSVSSPLYMVKNSFVNFTQFPNINYNVQVNRENGTIEVSMINKTIGDISGAGKFYLLRYNGQKWERINKLILDMILKPGESYLLYRDFTVEQGRQYTYALQQYDDVNNIQSVRETLGVAIADFEDMLLWDGERQLNIKFNPKVSSFKQTILETKQDTIGGKYPMFYRNGQVGYKDFPISGLISMLMDDNMEFMRLPVKADRYERLVTKASTEEIQENNFLTDLTGDNIAAERAFKLEVLNWLNDGKPKVFRSPTEGNYVVRLMNVSLSPNDTLGRMLHTFQANAYEIAELTPDIFAVEVENAYQSVAFLVVDTVREPVGLPTNSQILKIEGSSGSVIQITNSKAAKSLLLTIPLTGTYEVPKQVILEADSVELRSGGPCRVIYLSSQKENYFINETPVVYYLKIKQYAVGSSNDIENIHQILSLKARGWHDEEGIVSGELTLTYENGESLSLSVIDVNYSMQELIGVVGVEWNETAEIDITYLTTSPDNQEATSNE